MRGLVFLLLTVVLAGPAQADQTKKEKIAAILEAQHFREDIIAYAAQSRELIAEDARTALGPKLDEKATDTLFTELDKALKANLEGYIAELVEVYSVIFSDDEVQAAYDYHTSAIGKSISEKWPLYSREHARLDARWMQKVMETALAETRKVLEE